MYLSEMAHKELVNTNHGLKYLGKGSIESIDNRKELASVLHKKRQVRDMYNKKIATAKSPAQAESYKRFAKLNNEQSHQLSKNPENFV